MLSLSLLATRHLRLAIRCSLLATRHLRLAIRCSLLTARHLRLAIRSPQIARSNGLIRKRHNRARVLLTVASLGKRRAGAGTSLQKWQRNWPMSVAIASVVAETRRVAASVGGKHNREIAGALDITEGTVKLHVISILAEGLRSPTERKP
jgi:ATP/maltotriose-dependent transcriptional regulator MalT